MPTPGSGRERPDPDRGAPSMREDELVCDGIVAAAAAGMARFEGKADIDGAVAVAADAVEDCPLPCLSRAALAVSVCACVRPVLAPAACGWARLAVPGLES